MKLLIINGSPKRAKSNTDMMCKWFIEGVENRNEKYFRISYVQMSKMSMTELLEQMKGHDHIILAFPLYGYAMPAMCHELLLKAMEIDLAKKHFGTMIQYGFPEAVHGRPIERYLEKYAQRRGWTYTGAIVKGGCDNLFHQEDTKHGLQILEQVRGIGAEYGRAGKFDQTRTKSLSMPETQKKKSKWIMRIFAWAANRFYWKKKYTANGVSEKDSFARPYA